LRRLAGACRERELCDEVLSSHIAFYNQQRLHSSLSYPTSHVAARFWHEPYWGGDLGDLERGSCGVGRTDQPGAFLRFLSLPNWSSKPRWRNFALATGRPMISDRRPCALAPYLLGLMLLASTVHASAPDPSLVGCWRAVKIVLYAQDGSKSEDTSGRCTLRFEADRFESTCATSTGTATTTYRYRIERPHVYLATMTGSTFRTSLLGSTRVYEYEVVGDRLVTAATTQPTTPGGPSGVPRVESEAARTPCP
jgi:hypothetical protein